MPRHDAEAISDTEKSGVWGPRFRRARVDRPAWTPRPTLEHNPQGLPLYISDADYAAWRAASPSGPSDLTRVELRIAPVDRPDNAERQSIAVDNFWPAFFDAADVQSVSIDPAP